MVKETVLNIIQNYLHTLKKSDIQASRAVLFGSWARGEQREESDIDLIVIAPEFDNGLDRNLIDKLWELRVSIPEAWRIEPIACGERQWIEDNERAIIEIARREGQMITFEPQAA